MNVLTSKVPLDFVLDDSIPTTIKPAYAETQNTVFVNSAVKVSPQGVSSFSFTPLATTNRTDRVMLHSPLLLGHPNQSD